VPAATGVVHRIADSFTPVQIAAWIRSRLVVDTGPAAPRPPTLSRAAASRLIRVVWVERGDEVVVHCDSVKVAIHGGALLVSIDLECDQTGRQPLIVTLSLGGTGDAAGLIAMTDELPRGDGVLAARWGAAVQHAVWGALIELARQHATERDTFARGLVLKGEELHVISGPPQVVR
jgi:hypothetical protein